MNTAPHAPVPSLPEQHPAMLLAELVGLILGALGRRLWLWRLFPGGAALWAQLQQLGRDFTAIMQRVAAGVEVQPVVAGACVPSTRVARAGRATPRRTLYPLARHTPAGGAAEPSLRPSPAVLPSRELLFLGGAIRDAGGVSCGNVSIWAVWLSKSRVAAGPICD